MQFKSGAKDVFSNDYPNTVPIATYKDGVSTKLLMGYSSSLSKYNLAKSIITTSSKKFEKLACNNMIIVLDQDEKQIAICTDFTGMTLYAVSIAEMIDRVKVDEP